MLADDGTYGMPAVKTVKCAPRDALTNAAVFLENEPDFNQILFRVDFIQCSLFLNFYSHRLRVRMLRIKLFEQCGRTNTLNVAFIYRELAIIELEYSILFGVYLWSLY